jgi:hypothetical protein
MPRLHRQRDEELDFATLGHQVEGWWGIKYQSKLITKRLNEGKEALLKIVQRYGETQPETGSLFLELDEPVGDRKIVQLKAQRSETQEFNEEACEKILKDKGLWDDMVEWVPRLDEGKVHAAYFDKKITDDELARMFPRRVSFSLILLDDADKPVN